MKMRKYMVIVKFVNPNGTLSSRDYFYASTFPMALGGKYVITNECKSSYSNPVIVAKCCETSNDDIKEVYRTYVTHEIIKAVPVGVQVSEVNDKIKGVWFNKEKKTTVVKWHDGTVTKVTAQPEDAFNMEHGLALCYMKRWCFNNQGNYNNVFRKWIKEDEVK